MSFVEISKDLGREIAAQHMEPSEKVGIRKAISALAGVPESAVQHLNSGWRINTPDASPLLVKLEEVKARAEQKRKEYEAQREKEEKEFQDYCQNS